MLSFLVSFPHSFHTKAKNLGIPLTVFLKYDIIFQRLKIAQFYRQMWWNWQTRWTQNPVVVIPCGFDSHHLHQSAPPLYSNGNVGTQGGLLCYKYQKISRIIKKHQLKVSQKIVTPTENITCMPLYNRCARCHAHRSNPPMIREVTKLWGQDKPGHTPPFF